MTQLTLNVSGFIMSAPAPNKCVCYKRSLVDRFMHYIIISLWKSKFQPIDQPKIHIDIFMMYPVFAISLLQSKHLPISLSQRHLFTFVIYCRSAYFHHEYRFNTAQLAGK
jgi:hypothetical protein